MPPLISLSVVFALRKFSQSAATGKEHHWLVYLSVNKQNRAPFWFNKNNLISCLLNKKAAFLLIKQQIPSHLVVNKLCSSEWHYRCVHTHNAFKCILSVFHVNTDQGLLFVAGRPKKINSLEKL